jgi:hypothetical protein
MKSIYRILILVMGVGLMSRCADDGVYEHPIVHDNFPEVPILFATATTQGANPYYTVAWGTDGAGNALATPAANNIVITISVPDDAPLKIREITKMISGITGITPGNVAGGTTVTANYLPAPVAVNGTSTTITTNLAEFNTRTNPATSRVTAANVNAITATSPYVERAFMFLVTLEDGSTIITQQLRLRVIK